MSNSSTGRVVLQEFADFYLHNHYYYFSSLVMERALLRCDESISRSYFKAKFQGKTINTLSYDVFTSVPYLLMARFHNGDLIEKTHNLHLLCLIPLVLGNMPMDFKSCMQRTGKARKRL